MRRLISRLRDALPNRHANPFADLGLNEKIRAQILSSSLPREGLRMTVPQYVDQLLPHAAKRCGMDAPELRDRIIEINVTDRTEVNALTVSEKGGSVFRIYVNAGLFMFLYKMIKLFATRFGLMERPGEIIESPQLPLARYSTVAANLMTAYWSRSLSTTPGIEISELTDAQILLAGWFLVDAEKFVIAHELGHVILHLCKNSVEEIEWSATVVEHVIQVEKDCAAKYRVELAADLLGLDLVMKNLSHKPPFERSMAFSACELIFVMRSMLDQYHGIDKRYSMHPPANLRLRNLRIAGKTNPNTSDISFEFGEIFERLASNTLANI